jgi:hypothetical protein
MHAEVHNCNKHQALSLFYGAMYVRCMLVHGVHHLLREEHNLENNQDFRSTTCRCRTVATELVPPVESPLFWNQGSCRRVYRVEMLLV